MTDKVQPEWRRSTLCETGACVEVAHFNDMYLVRKAESPEGPVLEFTPLEWAAFVAGVREGDFDRLM